MSIHPETTLGAVSLTVRDLGRSLAFYRDLLGFEVQESGGVANLYSSGGRVVTLYEDPGATPKPQGTTGLYHYALLVPDRGALGRILKRLAGAGYPLWGASDHSVSEALYLDDPDGNGVEIYHDRPRSEWPYRNGSIAMEIDRLDLQSLLQEPGAQADWSGMPKGTTLGHMHLHVGDLEEAARFYRDLLGFEETARYGKEALFLSAGGYHHHVGLNTWAGIGAPRPPEGSAGLREFEVALPEAAEFERLSKRLEDSGFSPRALQGGTLRLEDPWGNGIVLSVAGVAAVR